MKNSENNDRTKNYSVKSLKIIYRNDDKYHGDEH